MSPARYDVLVVGGGPAGLATAIASARRGLGVLVVERDDYFTPRAGEHLPPRVRPLLEGLGVGDLLASGTAASCPGIRSAWGSSEPIDRNYVWSPYGEGLNLSRPGFDRRLASHAVQCGGKILPSSSIRDLKHTSGRWRFVVRGRRNVMEASATILVDATGRAAAIARRLGARPIIYDHLIGMVGHPTAAEVPDRHVVIEAVQDGWWYSTRLADASVIATFFTDPDLMDTSGGARVRCWCDRLRIAPLSRASIEPLAEIAVVQVRSARTQCLDIAAGEGWLAVGDAAMSFDPLSSDGISKGLDWGIIAADVISEAVGSSKGYPAAGYQLRVRREFAEYLITRFQYYAMEKRWPEAPFWRRRHVAPKPGARTNRNLGAAWR